MYNDWGAIGIDIWQVKSGTIFDNILVADSVEDAKAHAAKTFEPLSKAEKALKEKHDEEERKKQEEEEKQKDSSKKDEEEEEEDDDDSKKDEDHDEL